MQPKLRLILHHIMCLEVAVYAGCSVGVGVCGSWELGVLQRLGVEVCGSHSEWEL